MFQIFADKEVCICEARTEHMLVTLTDKVNADIVAVADGNEMIL